LNSINFSLNRIAWKFNSLLALYTADNYENRDQINIYAS